MRDAAGLELLHGAQESRQIRNANENKVGDARDGILLSHAESGMAGLDYLMLKGNVLTDKDVNVGFCGR